MLITSYNLIGLTQKGRDKDELEKFMGSV